MTSPSIRALLLLWSAVALALPATAQSMEDRARAAATASQGKTSSSEALLQNYVTPGLAGQPISTIDSKTSFTAALACAKSAKLLEVLVQPSPTGDLGSVRVARDTNMDGIFDTSLTLPMPVSGICANGIVSCQPGTWNGCKFFRWDVDRASALKLTQVDMPNVQSCYCINASCGTNLAWVNMPQVLGDLGGGIVGALTTADPRYGVAEAQINGPVIDYVGAQTTSCASAPALTQTSYATNPAAITGDATAQAAGNSIFQMLKGSPAGVGKVAEMRSCTIQRQVTITSPTYDDIITATGSYQSVAVCGSGCRRYRIGGTGSCDVPPPTFSARFILHKTDRLVSARIVAMDGDDWMQARVSGTPVASIGDDPWMTVSVPQECGTDHHHSAAPNVDLSGALKAGTVQVDALIRADGSHKSGTMDIEIQVDTGCRSQETLADLCGGYAADPQCTLQSESIDGVDTVKNGIVTGLTPLPTTRLFGSASCTVQLTRPFFERDRSYRCISDTGSPPAPDLTRAEYIIDHSTETLLADRIVAADGSVTTTSAPFSRPTEPGTPACEAICKTTALKVNTAAAPAGVVGVEQNVPTGTDTFYHVCDAANHCPIGAGETLVSDCGCLDTFPEAAVMMQTVRLAGAEISCTSTTRP
jgi:hypothetical protein